MLFKNIGILDENLEYKKNVFVGVDGDIIDYIGYEKPSKKYTKEYDGKNKLLMTGLINTHSHAAMTLLRGYAEALPLYDWLQTKVFPFEARLTSEDIFNGTKLAIAEMLRFGTVSFSDMYMQGGNIAKAVLETGIKCNMCIPALCFDNSSYFNLPMYIENEYLIKHYNNSGDKRLKVDFAIHAEYTSTERVVKELAFHAQKKEVNVQVHLSETKKEHEECKQRHNKTPASYFEEAGLFDIPTTAAHCVWLEDSDMDILLNNNVTAAINPASNLKLASGFAKVSKMLKRGINLSLGTDGCASNNNLNMFKDLYLFALIYKGFELDATAVSSKDGILAATLNGAKAQGRPDCGQLKIGNKADLIVLNLDVPNMYPNNDILHNIVYSFEGSDVVLTMVDGKVLFNNGEYLTLDIEKVKYNAQRSTIRILSEV